LQLGGSFQDSLPFQGSRYGVRGEGVWGKRLTGNITPINSGKDFQEARKGDGMTLSNLGLIVGSQEIRLVN